MRTFVFTCALLTLAACSNGGRFTLESNGILSVGSSKLIGSCSVTGQPIVMTEGYCVEFQRTSPSADNPELACSGAGGLWMTQACVRGAGLAGRCLVKNGSAVDTVYFFNGANGPAHCQATANSTWQDSGTF